jgi:hypothetical protein
MQASAERTYFSERPAIPYFTLLLTFFTTSATYRIKNANAFRGDTTSIDRSEYAFVKAIDLFTFFSGFHLHSCV